MRILVKPQLLCKDNPELDKLEYPYIALPKLDGIRCLATDTGPVSRTLKQIPNLHIRKLLTDIKLAGFDGELIVGKPTDKDVYRNTNSAVMAHDGTPDFKYYVFDIWDSEETFAGRTASLEKRIQKIQSSSGLYGFLEITPWMLCWSERDVLNYEEEMLSLGYEGLILRSLNGMYKQGRTTMKEQNSYKLKRYCDDEAIVINMVPEYENTNEATINEVGNTKRSTAQAGLVAKETLGALLVYNHEWGTFSIGTGFTKEERANLWQQKESFISKVAKFKYFPVGIKDKPRHPVFLGFRDMEIDG